MTRLVGDRWADVRPLLGARVSTTLTTETGRLLRRLHSVRGTRFGDLVGPAFDSAWSRVADRRDALLDEFVRVGGRPGLAARVQLFVDARHDAVSACALPSLCHHDVIDGNLLLSGRGEDRHVTGVVDLEGATWDDPMSDLAQTRIHVELHRPADVRPLEDSYGVGTEGEQLRLEVYDVLHRVRERSWIAEDRPPGWAGSVAALDRAIDDRV